MNARTPLLITNLSSLDISNQKVKFERKSVVSSILMELGHPHKMFRFPHFFGKVKKKNSESLLKFKEASALVYKHTILSY